MSSSMISALGRVLKMDYLMYTKHCPTCGTTQSYKTRSAYNKAQREIRACRSCCQLGKIDDDKNPAKRMSVRKKISRSLMGENHPMFGKHHTTEWKQKVGDAVRGEKNGMFGKTHTKETRLRMRKNHSRVWLGKRHSADTIRKQRLGAIDYINSMKGQCTPRYNPFACQRIDEYGKKHGYHFQHAERGGEFHIPELGYWVDGYDKVKNVVVEYYENAHHKTIERDTKRKREIINHLGCKFIELWES